MQLDVSSVYVIRIPIILKHVGAKCMFKLVQMCICHRYYSCLLTPHFKFSDTGLNDEGSISPEHLTQNQ